MSTRAIITTQPDVACDVCERRLLRGEQHDIFLAAGHRRTVCELCAPRATHEGWRREADGEALTLAPPRPRRGRNLFERLRQVGRAPSEAGPLEAERLSYAPEPERRHEPEPRQEPEPLLEPELRQEPDLAPYEQQPAPARREPQPYDFLGGLEIVDSKPGETEEPSPPSLSPTRLGGMTSAAERGIEVFNTSEFPRRIAGIARSLGPPAVNVCQVEDTVGETVSIVIAWELCWYRYEVDLDVEAPAARLAAQGTELEELARGERHANTPVDGLGLLSTSAA